MDKELVAMKEEALLLAKDKIEDAIEALSENFSDLADEVNWLLDELGNQLRTVRAERLGLMNSSLYASEETI